LGADLAQQLHGMPGPANGAIDYQLASLRAKGREHFM
jgi:hypothetical protein